MPGAPAQPPSAAIYHPGRPAQPLRAGVALGVRHVYPLPDERVGLSIVGLYQLGQRRQDASELADRLATFIGYAANWERELTRIQSGLCR